MGMKVVAKVLPKLAIHLERVVQITAPGGGAATRVVVSEGRPRAQDSGVDYPIVSPPPHCLVGLMR